MPFQGEGASALGGNSILKSDHFKDFLSKVNIVPGSSPDTDLLSKRVQEFHPVTLESGLVVAIDGSDFAHPLDSRTPWVFANGVKVGRAHLDISDYLKMTGFDDGFVDPSWLAKMQRCAEEFGRVVGGAGLCFDDIPTSRGLFRYMVFSLFRDQASDNWRPYDAFIYLLQEAGNKHDRRVRFNDHGERVVVLREGDSSPVDGTSLLATIEVPVEPGFTDVDGQRYYATDALRVHETWNDVGSNGEAIGRLRSALEHIALADTLRTVIQISQTENDKGTRRPFDFLSSMIIMLDGPLSINGEAAKLHRGVMRLIHKARELCLDADLETGPLVMGLVKSGVIVEHGKILRPLFDKERAGRKGVALGFPVDDDYRFEVIQRADSKRPKNFGAETYYGQTFILSPSVGSTFVVDIAYPFPSKSGDFVNQKVNLSAYGRDIDRVCGALDLFRTHMFEDGLSPVSIAHRISSVAQQPNAQSMADAIKRRIRSVQS